MRKVKPIFKSEIERLRAIIEKEHRYARPMEKEHVFKNPKPTQSTEETHDQEIPSSQESPSTESERDKTTDQESTEENSEQNRDPSSTQGQKKKKTVRFYLEDDEPTESENQQQDSKVDDTPKSEPKSSSSSHNLNKIFNQRILTPAGFTYEVIVRESSDFGPAPVNLPLTTLSYESLSYFGVAYEKPARVPSPHASQEEIGRPRRVRSFPIEENFYFGNTDEDMSDGSIVSETDSNCSNNVCDHEYDEAGVNAVSVSDSNCDLPPLPSHNVNLDDVPHIYEPHTNTNVPINNGDKIDVTAEVHPKPSEPCNPKEMQPLEPTIPIAYSQQHLNEICALDPAFSEFSPCDCDRLPSPVFPDHWNIF